MSKPDAAARPASPSGRAGYAKSLDTRARILAATLEEAGDSGFHKASVARIAARAGVAVGNLHYHFGSRGQLLRELMGSLMADLLPRLHAADADDDADFFERERAGLLVYLATCGHIQRIFDWPARSGFTNRACTGARLPGGWSESRRGFGSASSAATSSPWTTPKSRRWPTSCWAPANFSSR